VGINAFQQVAEVSTGELPAERPGNGVLADLESGEALPDLIQAGEVVGREDFSLHDGEVDFGLIQPGGVGW
jgi:hypothetical protein